MGQVHTGEIQATWPRSVGEARLPKAEGDIQVTQVQSRHPKRAASEIPTCCKQ